MGFYERQFGEMEKEKKKTAQPERPHGRLAGNYDRLLIDNFKLLLFLLPFLICFYIGLAAGMYAVLLIGLLLLIPAGAAVAAMYDEGFQIARRIEKRNRRGFFESCRLNWKQGCATMALLVPMMAVLLLLLLVTVERPVWVIVCLVLGGYLLISFAINSFAQIALVPLSLLQIWKNAVILIFLCGWRGLMAALMQLAALALLYEYIAYASIGLLFLGPALLITWSAMLLFPKLEVILVRK